MKILTCAVFALPLALATGACASGGESTTTFGSASVSATATATATATGTAGSGTSSTGSGSGGSAASSGSGSGSGSGSAGSDTGTAGSTGMASGSGGTGGACDPVIPGEWNACVDMGGNVDNTLCKWMGMGGATGFIGCLSSASNPDANVCFISGCEDVCDCFAPPATGTAPVVCSEILQGGGKGCALSCANQETCPDGMTCLDGLCFWAP